MKQLVILLASLFAFETSQANPDTLFHPAQPGANYSVLGLSTSNSQVAIIANVAQTRFYGSQLSAMFNLSTGYMRGMQMAGVGNMAMDTMQGAQLAGVLNIASKSVDGVQAAGTLNIAGGDVRGVQVAGTANVCGGNVEVLQMAGTLNVARDVRGLQTSGAANIAFGTVRGAQISGFVNYAKNLKGLQLGVFNFADSASGAMIGVFSYARHGYHKIELGWNETTPLNFAIRTGSMMFHNNFTVGIDFRPRDPFWSVGYGIGTAWPISKRIDIGAELTAAHVNRGGFTTTTSELFKLEVPVDFHLLKKMSIAVGPSFNVFLNDTRVRGNELPVNQFPPYYAFTQTYNNHYNVKAWFGVSASLRFF